MRQVGVFQWLRRAGRLIAVTLIMVLMSQVSISAAKPQQPGGQYRYSTDKHAAPNAKALGAFWQDSSVLQQIQEAIGKGHSFKLNEPVFVEIGDIGDGGDWRSVTVTGEKGKKHVVVVTGFFNATTNQVELVTVLEGRQQEDGTTKINSTRIDKGVKVKQAGATFDPDQNLWVGDDGKVLTNETSSLLQFGQTAYADLPEKCESNFICNMVTGSYSVLLCAVAGLATVVLGIVCGLIMVLFTYLLCTYDYGLCD